jgi:fumarate hydratase subunit alpha
VRTIPAQDVIDAVAKMAAEANYELGEDMVRAIEKTLVTESSPVGRDVLGQILKNAGISREGRFPLCQDTGLAILFVEIGEDVRVDGGLNTALTEGVRVGYADGFLRKSVCDPFSRENTGDNAPAVIHVNIAPGDGLVIDFLAKGGGCENMSRAAVLAPAAGEEGVIDYVVDVVREGAVNACPPITVGLGIGGDLELAAIIAKKALTRPVGQPSDDPQLARIEAAALERINRLGIGPAGLGGDTTALVVHAAAVPCHIASLPVAVVIECHAHRHGRIEL